MGGPVIWITGLSGAGKTTLCEAVRDRLRPHVGAVVMLDGDLIREAFDGDLGYGEADRVRQIRRMQRLAKLIADQGVAVVVAALYSNAHLLAWNRANLPGYHEVYLEASLESLAGRDAKGHYAAYARGAITNLVGLDIPFTPPDRPDVVFDANRFGDLDTMAATVVDAVITPARQTP
jgi:cytidine diphosphoramidate kinase